MRKNEPIREDSILSIHSKDRSALRDKAIFYKGASIALFTLSLVLVLSVVFLAIRPKTEIPYVIEINASGDAKYVSDAVSKLSSWQPSKTTIMNILRDYIVCLRGVSTDSAIQEERIKKVYSFSTATASKYAGSYLKQTSPMKRLSKESVTVDVYAITPMVDGSETTYQLDWNERVFTLQGNLKSENNYRAIVSIAFFKPRTQLLQESNPLGIYVKDISVSEIKDGYVIL